MKLGLASMSALVAAIALLSAPAARAEPKPETEQQAEDRLAKSNFAMGGFYFGAEGLAAVENSPLISGDKYIVSGGLDLRLGHRHNRWFATEFSGLYVHTFGDGTGNFLAWGISLNERFYLTRRRLQPYLTAGGGILQLRSRTPSVTGGGGGFDLKFAMQFGLGMEIYANESFAFTLVANYYLPVGVGTDLDFITAGAGFMFF